jgi:Dyp-type peroxidase family
MTAHLDCADIQCFVLNALAAEYPKAKYFVINIPDPKNDYGSGAARAFILEYRKKVTTALPWRLKKHEEKPDVAINIAISWWGLVRLGLPARTLAAMPGEFIDGMAKRALILGDPTVNGLEGGNPANWDAPWLDDKAHILVCLNAKMDPQTGLAVPALATESAALKSLCDQHGLTILTGHTNSSENCQDATLLLKQQGGMFVPTPKEHFGFTDGISNPVFEGQFDEQETHAASIGQGKLVPNGNGKSSWEPLATGEFLLGHADEAQEIPGSSMPDILVRNATFLVYRKLHQYVGSFDKYLDEQATTYAKLKSVAVVDAREILMAKMAGRWSDGVPLSKAPTIEKWRAFDRSKQLDFVDFSFGDDPDGVMCPVTSHMRRVNTRDSLDPSRSGSSKLNNRRRLLRRGLPYGEGVADDQSGHGVIVMAMCASIGRQFEFVQQQWLQYGLDASAGNDDCPLLGARLSGDRKFVVPVRPDSGEAPFICADLPKFVEARGGEYFFVPSITALRMIAMGVVDPT